MAQGYETRLALKEQTQGWGSTGNLGNGINPVEPDSLSPDFGIVQNRRSGKARGQRNLQPSLVTSDFMNPAGAFTLQPRAVELLPLFMSHFQVVEVVNGTVFGGGASEGTFQGTLRFAPANKTPDSVGSNWGTWRSPSAAGGGGTNYSVEAEDLYAITTEQSWGTLTGGSPTTQTIFNHGYVDRIELTQAFDEDLLMTFNMRHKGTSVTEGMIAEGGDFGTNFETSSLRFAGWTATMTVDGTANEDLDVENLTVSHNAQGEGKGRIGQYGFGRYTFTDDEHVVGISLEFKNHDLFEKVLNDGSFAVSSKWQVSGESEWIQFDAPACKMRPVTPSSGGGDQTVEIDYEMEAFGLDGTPSVYWSVFVSYGTQLLSLDVGEGTKRG